MSLYFFGFYFRGLSKGSRHSNKQVVDTKARKKSKPVFIKKENATLQQ
jgi:hypothetical protein